MEEEDRIASGTGRFIRKLPPCLKRPVVAMDRTKVDGFTTSAFWMWKPQTLRVGIQRTGESKRTPGLWLRRRGGQRCHLSRRGPSGLGHQQRRPLRYSRRKPRWPSATFSNLHLSHHVHPGSHQAVMVLPAESQPLSHPLIYYRS